MTMFIDASLVVCHLTGEPPALATAARECFASDELILVSDVVVADVVRLLEAVYAVDRHLVATALRSLLARPTSVCVDTPVLLRAIGLYEIEGLSFASAYTVALAESTSTTRVASFDTAIDRVRSVERVGTDARGS